MSLAYGLRQPCDGEPAGGSCEPCAESSRRWVLAVSVLGSSLAFIEGSIVNLALPALQADLKLDSVGLQWVVNAYLLALSSLVLVGGAAGDRFGIRQIFVLGLVLFGLSSCACGLVSDARWLIAWRAAQGAGSALLVPTSLALLNVHFEPQDRPRAIGIWAGASALTTALGPLLGGTLVDHFGWRSIFLLMLPLTAIACALALAKVPSRSGDSRRRLDFVGAALLVAALAPLTLVLASFGSDANPIPALVIGLAALLGFFFFESRVADPMLPLGLFRRRQFSGANAMTFLLYFALGGALFFVPFNLIQVQGYSALQAGLAFLPLTLLLGFGSVLAGEQLKRRSPRRLLAAGAALTGVGFALLVIPATTSSYAIHWLPGITTIGVGMTLCVAPLTTVIMTSVDESQSGVASGINNLAARMAGLLAIAALTSLAVYWFRSELGEALLSMPLSENVRVHLLARAHELAGIDLTSAEGTAGLAEAVHDSYVTVFRRLMLTCAGLALAAAAIAWSTIQDGDSSRV